MGHRLLRSVLVALTLAVVVPIWSGTPIAHADEPEGFCASSARAVAFSSDNSVSASSSGGFGFVGSSKDTCVGRAQTAAILQAGYACQNAGIPAGLVYGLGYATVTWDATWTTDYLQRDGLPVSELLAYAQQVYDCGDTFT